MKKYKLIFLGRGLYLSGYRLIKKFLKNKFPAINFEVAENCERITKSCDLVISLGYDKIISREYLLMPKKGVVVFHSSNLPMGRGWAPLYYALSENKKIHTITMFFADEGIDTGDIIAKAKCNIDISDTINDLRRKDDFLTLKLLERYLLKILTKTIKGKKQQGKGNYNKKRNPEDSEVFLEEKFEDLYFKLRALDNNKYPAFFTINGRKFSLKLYPAENKKQKTEYKILNFIKYGKA